MSLEDKLADLRKKYRELLRDGKTKEATEVAQKAEELKEGDESQSGFEKFEVLNGVGEEIAKELAEDFDSIEALAEATPEDITPIPGIGEKRAKSIIEQAQGE